MQQVHIPDQILGCKLLCDEVHISSHSAIHAKLSLGSQ